MDFNATTTKCSADAYFLPSMCCFIDNGAYYSFVAAVFFLLFIELWKEKVRNVCDWSDKYHISLFIIFFQRCMHDKMFVCASARFMIRLDGSDWFRWPLQKIHAEKLETNLNAFHALLFIIFTRFTYCADTIDQRRGMRAIRNPSGRHLEQRGNFEIMKRNKVANLILFSSFSSFGMPIYQRPLIFDWHNCHRSIVRIL